MTDLAAKATTAMETMKCPRCGGRLHYRDVLTEAGGAISTVLAELYDIYGHSYPVLIKDFLERRARCQQTGS